jgi:molybdopterin molybdotransferase
MRPDLFPRLITFDDAKSRVLAAARPVTRIETVELTRAGGRVVARAVLSTVDVPTFDRAAMDGYAVIAADLLSASKDRPASLQLIGEVYTGDVPTIPVRRGTCIAIGTGAPLPDGADSVVMVEQTSREGDHVNVVAPATAGQNIGRRGADLGAGAVVVAADQVLTPARIGCLAAIGATAVEVFAKPTVALLSTGNEITPPGQPLPTGHVYDVNRFTVGALIERHGGTGVPMAAAGDSIEALTDALDRAASCDVIVFSGGSSVGARDLMLDALEARGEVDFHGIAVKPGKPTLFGRIGAAAVFGMPGNPTSCLSNAYMLLVPFLRRVARLPPWQPLTVTAPLARRVSSTAGRHQFYTVRLQDGQVFPAFKSSGDITSMADADGFIEIPADVGHIEAGTQVVVTML